MAHVERAERLCYAKVYYERNRDAVKAKQKEWRESANGSRHRFSRTLKKHGITAHDFALMWVSQSGNCAGCFKPLDDGQNTHIDHCHSTGFVRGLLCSACNLALGKVDDSADTLLRLVNYLNKGGCRG